MLNAKSGIAELLPPMGGGSTVRRQEATGQDTSGLFGDTLKGQMNRAAEGQNPGGRRAEKAADTEKQGDTAKSVRTTTEQDEPAKAVETGAETAPATEAVAVDDAATDGAVTTPIIALIPQEVMAETEPALPVGDMPLPEETVDSGNFLPPALPQMAADNVDAVLAEGSEDAGSLELPRWMHALAAAGHGREQSVAGRGTAQEQPVLTTEAEDMPDGAFLKGWQMVTAQLDTQAGDSGSRQGAGQGAEALFKLVGLAAPKDLAAPAMNMAASTVSAAANGATNAPAPTSASMPQLALDTPMRQAGWDQAFAERVVWMAKQGVQEAQIHLNPRNMGPIEVHVSMQKEQATVAFVAHHAVTREALEAAMPRLRDMLQESGLNLAQAEVSQHDRQREQAAAFAGGQERGQRGQGGAAANDEGILAETPLRGGTSPGGVDYYA